MPITKKQAPGTLPDAAKNIYVAAWNAAYEDTCGKREDRDECASKIAWSAVKAKYARRDDEWVPKAALIDISLTITKASLQPDGTMRWLAVCSDTNLDRTGEATSLGLFQDWIERVETGKSASFLPLPRNPFLGLSHYPALSGNGEAGSTEKMYIDGNRFKAGGVFHPDRPLGKALFEAIRGERDLIKRGNTVEQPIRISAGWWDLSHRHGDFVFERKSLFDVCPMCEQGTGGKTYIQGQLDHFAATRVPINPRTSLGLEEKSMAKKKTRKDDAASIVGDELAEDLDKQVKPVGKSETELPPAMVTKAKKEPDVEPMEVEAKEVTEPEIEQADVEKMGEMKEEVYRPYGGAMTLADADSYVQAQEQVGQVHGTWGMFQALMDNVLDESKPEELKANVQKLTGEFGNRVAAIKAAVEDAVLIEESGGIQMSEQQTQEQAHPADALKAAVDDALTNADLDRTGKLEAIQSALAGYAEAVKADVDAVAPADPGETIKAALDPVLDKLDLIAEKLGHQPQAQAPAPQQKSFVPKGPGDNQPDDLQKPPTLREIVRKSVGIH